MKGVILLAIISAVLYGNGFNGWGIVMGFSIFIAVLGTVFVATTTLSNANTLAKLEVFYEVNSQNYEVAIDNTASYLSQEQFTGSMVDGSVEKWQQAGYVSERIKEWRNAVNDYNTQIASFKYYDSNLFTSNVVPNRVQDFKFLIIK